MRIAGAALLLVTILGCSGIFSQSFDESFEQLCLEEHAVRVEGLTDAKAACACAKTKIEEAFESPLERLTALADPDQMESVLEECMAEAAPEEPEAEEAEEPAEIEDVEPPADPLPG